jgi:threonyl-tRNA synthetase
MSSPTTSPPPGGEPAGPSPRRAAELLRHTALHVLELAVWRAFPGVEPAGGGVSPDALWADFDLEETLTPADFPRLEAEARKIVAADLPLERVELGTAEAATELRRQRSKLRAEFFAEGAAAGPVAFVRLGELFTPCAGEHLARTGQVGAFQLLSVSGAYFRDDETRPMLQRLYGAAFADPQALEEYLARREAAGQSDHR